MTRPLKDGEEDKGKGPLGHLAACSLERHKLGSDRPTPPTRLASTGGRSFGYRPTTDLCQEEDSTRPLPPLSRVLIYKSQPFGWLLYIEQNKTSTAVVIDSFADGIVHADSAGEPEVALVNFRNTLDQGHGFSDVHKGSVGWFPHGVFYEFGE